MRRPKLRVQPDSFFELAGCYRRYHVPLSRTVFLGTPPDFIRRAETALIEGLEAGLDAARPGNRACDIAGALGAEVGKVDLSELDDESFLEIRRALLRHLVLFFREQTLSDESHKAFGRRFGPLFVHPHVAPLAGHPEVIEIVKGREDDD